MIKIKLHTSECCHVPLVNICTYLQLTAAALTAFKTNPILNKENNQLYFFQFFNCLTFYSV